MQSGASFSSGSFSARISRQSSTPSNHRRMRFTFSPRQTERGSTFPVIAPTIPQVIKILKHFTPWHSIANAHVTFVPAHMFSRCDAPQFSPSICLCSSRGSKLTPHLYCSLLFFDAQLGTGSSPLPHPSYYATVPLPTGHCCLLSIFKP
jgi:hypothetical protein